MTTVTSSTTFDYDDHHPLSPTTQQYSNSPLSWDMTIYNEEPNNNQISGTGKRSPKRGVSTFINKLYGMVNDRTNQQLISWNPSGTSFLVCNATRFAQEVLPIHFKHSNFSSFVRQLNMYGFHKINKSLRGQRGNNENEVWEFSHVKFQYGRPDLLEGIKRKAMDSELLRRETGDIHASFSMIQMSQSDLLQQFNTLQDQFSNLLTSFEELKKTQLQQQIIIRRLTDATVIHQQSSSSSEKMKVNHSPPPNVLMSQWQQQNHNTNDNDNVLSMCTPESMTLPLSDLQCLPPSPALSDPLSHSQHPSFHTADDTFHRDHLHQSNTLELSFAT